MSREVANNGGRKTYRAVAADRRAAECARRPEQRNRTAARSWSPRSKSG